FAAEGLTKRSAVGFLLRSLIVFQTFISRHNSNFFSDKLVLTSVTPASSAPVLQTPKATSSTLYFDSLTVNAGNGPPRFGGMKTYNWEGVNPDGYFLDKLEPIPSALPSFQKLFQVSATALSIP